MIVLEFIAWLWAAMLRHWELVVAIGIPSGIALVIGLRQIRIASAPPQVASPSEAERQRARARVSAQPGPIRNFAPGLRPITTVELRNHGETPALDLTVQMWSAVDVYPVPANHVFMKPAIETAPSSVVLHPRAEPVESTVRWSVELSEQNVMDISRGTQWRIYDYGTASYRDVFGELHQTDFCFMRGGASMADGRSDICPLHNRET